MGVPEAALALGVAHAQGGPALVVGGELEAHRVEQGRGLGMKGRHDLGRRSVPGQDRHLSGQVLDGEGLRGIVGQPRGLGDLGLGGPKERPLDQGGQGKNR